MSPAVIDWPHWVPLAAAISRTLALPVSVMYRSPAESSATCAGPSNSAAEAGPPSPVLPEVPEMLPAMP